MKIFKLEILTPKGDFIKENVSLLNIKIANGYIGLLPKHTSLISYIQPSKFLFYKNKDPVEGIIRDGVIFMDGETCKIITSQVIFNKDYSAQDLELKLSEWSEKQEVHPSHVSN